MSASADSPDLTQRRRIAEQGERFKRAWCTGPKPSIEAYVDEAPEPDRPHLLHELVAVEIQLRRERGEHPAPFEYHDRFPDYKVLVDAAFAEDSRGGLPADAATSPPKQSKPDTARSLLFGILALQNNFIDRAALLSAFNVWTEDKAKPLGQILVEHGKLDASRHELLNALVAEHLKLHDDDPDRSLAALGPLGPVRRDLEHLADADLSVSLGHLGGSRSLRADPDATPSWIGTPTSGGARFRIIRLHAPVGWVKSSPHSTRSFIARLRSSTSRTTTPTTPIAAPASSRRPRSPAASSIRESCRCMGLVSMTTVAPSTRCAWSREIASELRLHNSTRLTRTRSATPASG